MEKPTTDKDKVHQLMEELIGQLMEELIEINHERLQDIDERLTHLKQIQNKLIEKQEKYDFLIEILK